MPQKVLTQSGLPALWARVEALTRSAVTALQELINTKADQTALAAKADASHTHSYNDLTDLPDISATGTTGVIAAVTTCQPVMQLLLSCPDSAETFWQWQSGVGQGIATYAGIDSQDLRDCQTLGAVAASSTAMSAISSSAAALNAIVKNNTASSKIQSKIGTYRSQVISACSNMTYFSKNTGNRVSTGITDGIGTNTVYIPQKHYDDYTEQYPNYYSTIEVYAGCDDSYVCEYTEYHNGYYDMDYGVALRGVRTVGGGEEPSHGEVVFDIYTAK